MDAEDFECPVCLGKDNKMREVSTQNRNVDDFYLPLS